MLAMEALRAVPQVDWNFFRQVCLPSVSDDVLEAFSNKFTNNRDDYVNYLNQITPTNSRITFKRFSGCESCKFKPDFVASLLETRGVRKQEAKEEECDVVFLAVIKDDNADDNIERIIESANYLLSSDPTRKFLLGMTIDKTIVRFWFFSASLVMVTHELKREENSRDITHFFLAFMNASDEELGFDLSVLRVRELQCQCIINQTIRSIALPSSDPPFGQSRRLWEAQEVHSEGKDSFGTNTLWYNTPKVEHSPGFFKRQVRCRTLLENFGRPLYDEITNHKTVLEALIDAIGVLEHLRSIDYIHRDISPSNLLVTHAENENRVVCKLIDFDHAEPTSFSPGSPNFISVEVKARRYRFRPASKALPIPGLITTPFEAPKRPFRHNCLHDIESLFWILIYVLFSTYPEDRPTDDPIERHRMFTDLFPDASSASDGERFDFLRCDSFRYCDYLDRLPLEFKQEAQYVDVIAAVLRSQYEEIEACPDFDFDGSEIDFGEAHDLFRQYFAAVVPSVFDGRARLLWPSMPLGGREDVLGDKNRSLQDLGDDPRSR